MLQAVSPNEALVGGLIICPGASYQHNQRPELELETRRRRSSEKAPQDGVGSITTPSELELSSASDSRRDDTAGRPLQTGTIALVTALTSRSWE